ncbi:MAG: D-glycerate dehydrogenase [Rhodospirillaceae bacterium]
MKPKVLITRRWPADVEARLTEHFDVTFNLEDRPLAPDAMKRAFRQHDAVFTAVTDRIDADVLSGDYIRARLIGNFGVGFNNIDVKAAAARGIAVTNTPDVLTDATADLALALILAVARRVGEGERHVREKAWTGWRPTHMLGRHVTGATLGVIGYGRIGQATARRAHHGFGMKIKVYSRSSVPADVLAENAAEQVAAVEDLLPLCDFVSLHCPATAENHHMIDAAMLKRMKSGGILINTGRGGLVNEADLAAALDAGEIAGAGLDVFDGEPAVPDFLVGRDDVVLLPHLGSATLETRNAMGFRVMKNAVAFFAGEKPLDRVA